MVSPDGERVLARRYRLLRKLGQGGMGVVWEGYDTLLDRPIAIKEVLLPPGLPPVEHERLLLRTAREARATAKVSHPAIVSVYDVAEEDDRPWIIMELVRAPSLEELVRTRGATPVRQVADIGLQVLSALRAAHAAGVLHRDVKPANILVREDGRAVLTDFGLAAVDDDGSLTRTGTVAGSPAYLAPERARGGRARPASDLWSLGATLYAAVIGRSPFERADTMSTLNAVLTEDPDLSRVPRVLHPVLRGLLRRDPAERIAPERAREMLAAIGTPPADRAAGGGRRRILIVGGAVVVTVALAMGGWLVLGAQTSGSPPADASARRTAPAAAPVADLPTPTPSPSRRRPALRTWTAPAGWSIPVPRGWKGSRSKLSAEWLRRDGDAHLRVRELPGGGGTPLAILDEERAAITAHTIRTGPVAIDEGQAAEWEFTWVAGTPAREPWARPGRTYHELRRAIIAGNTTYILEWTTLEEEWKGQRRLLRQVLRGFDPA